MLPRVSEEVYAEAKRLFRNGADDETIFVFLKQNVAGPVDAIIFLREVQSLPLIDAKRVINDSETWAYARVDWESELRKAESELDSEP
jgi:hypothetical protein